MTININGTTGISGVDGSAGTPAIQGSDTNTGVFFGTNTIDLSTDGTSRLSIGADGDLNVDSGTLFVDASTNRVGIGNTSPSFALDIQGTAGTGDFGNGQLLNLSGGTISAADTGVGIGFLRTGSQMAYIQARRENNSNEAAYLAFATQTSAGLHPERMRIDSDGNVLIATVNINDLGTVSITFDPTAKRGITFRPTSDNNSPNPLRFLNSSGTPVGNVITDETSTAYNESSDYRLKENIVPLTGATERLKGLKPSRFNFIVDPTKTVDGFLAHETQSVVPEAVFGEKDAVDDEGNPEYQGIDKSKLVPLLTAALQEAIAKIETLEARLSVLEGGAN